MPRARAALRAPPHVAPTRSPRTLTPWIPRRPSPSGQRTLSPSTRHHASPWQTGHRRGHAQQPCLARPPGLATRRRRRIASTRCSGAPSRRSTPTGHGSTQLLRFLALAVTLTALLVLASVTLTAALAALVLLSPLVLLTVPLWAPVAVLALLTGVASLVACCAGLAAVAAGTWAHRYFTGRYSVGAHRVQSADQYARGGTVADVASRVRGYYDAYAREYGGYPPRPHSRVKDAAPGA